MYCSKCGQENSSGARFCGGCGRELQKPPKNKLVPTFVLLCLLAGTGFGYATDWSFQLAKEPESEGTEAKAVTDDEKEIHIKKAPTVVKETKQQAKDKTVLIKESLPSVFTIGTDSGTGSGFLYKSGGYIVTNAHVVAGYTDVVVRNSKGKDMAGKVIGISERYDIALIQSAANKNVKPLVTEMKETPIGTEVIALGSPNGFENTASIGYLTGLNRDMEMDFIYEKIYQIDAQIDHGSSGGPLLDATTGKVIGINSLLYKENTVFGFSIPMHSMKSLVDQWIKQPMSNREVASLFDVYDDYQYYDSAVEYEDYEYDYDFEDELAYEEEDMEEEYVEDREAMDEVVSDFYREFRDQYEDALANDDYSYIAGYILPGSQAELEFSDYISKIADSGASFKFIVNSPTKIQYNDDETIDIYTYETFDFTNMDGVIEFNERSKIYTVVVNRGGDLQVVTVSIQ